MGPFPELRATARVKAQGWIDRPDGNLALPALFLTAEDRRIDTKRWADLSPYINENLDKLLTGVKPWKGRGNVPG